MRPDRPYVTQSTKVAVMPTFLAPACFGGSLSSRVRVLGAGIWLSSRLAARHGRLYWLRLPAATPRFSGTNKAPVIEFVRRSMTETCERVDWVT
jgi:hypothetical protein